MSFSSSPTQNLTSIITFMCIVRSNNNLCERHTPKFVSNDKYSPFLLKVDENPILHLPLSKGGGGGGLPLLEVKNISPFFIWLTVGRLSQHFTCTALFIHHFPSRTNTPICSNRCILWKTGEMYRDKQNVYRISMLWLQQVLPSLQTFIANMRWEMVGAWNSGEMGWEMLHGYIKEIILSILIRNSNKWPLCRAHFSFNLFFSCCCLIQ